MHDRDRSYQNRDGEEAESYQTRDGEAAESYQSRDRDGAESYRSRDGEAAESYQSRDREGVDEWRLLSITDRFPVAGDGWRLARAILKRQAGSRVATTIMYRPLADARDSEKTAC